MKTISIVLTALLLLVGCVSPMHLSQTREFALSMDTPITVSVQNDYAGVQGRVEGKLIELGLNVVPVDVARKAIELKQATTVKGNSALSKSTLESNIYYPTALIVSVSYQTRRDGIMEGFAFFNARFIDLSTQRVLGVASFSQGTNWVTMNFTLDSFAKEIAEHVK
jgi:hypothetical protein